MLSFFSIHLLILSIGQSKGKLTSDLQMYNQNIF